jgi:hypothetical protein
MSIPTRAHSVKPTSNPTLPVKLKRVQTGSSLKIPTESPTLQRNCKKTTPTLKIKDYDFQDLPPIHDLPYETLKEGLKLYFFYKIV